MQDLFEFDKTELVKTKEKKESKLLTKEQKQKLRYSKRDDNCEMLLKEKGGFPKQSEFYAFKTSGETDAGSFFTYALRNWETIAEMYLATWTISRHNVGRIREAVESGKLQKLTFIISNTMKPANPALYNHLITEMKALDQVTIKEAPSHAKTFSIWDGKNNYITVSGSANWSKNPRIENYLLFNDVDLFNHHKEWMNELT